MGGVGGRMDMEISILMKKSADDEDRPLLLLLEDLLLFTLFPLEEEPPPIPKLRSVILNSASSSADNGFKSSIARTGETSFRLINC